MSVYGNAMKVEKKIVDKLKREGMKKYGTIKVLEKNNKFSRADLIYRTPNNEVKAFEIKTRCGHYNLSFLKRFNPICEMSKIEELNKKYGIMDMTLITITSDNYVLEGEVSIDMNVVERMSPRTTSFQDTQKISKRTVEADISKCIPVKFEEYIK